MLGTCFEQMRDFNKADENYRLVWQLFPRSAWADDALFRVSNHLLTSPDLEDVRAAKSYLLKLQALYPKSPLIAESLCLLGEGNERLGEFDKHAESGLASRAHFALGRLYCEDQNPLRDLERAMEEFRLVIEEDSKGAYAPWAYFSIGNILREQKKWEYARPYFQTVVEQFCGTLCAAAARPMLTLSQVERDQFMRGRESFEQLLALINRDHPSEDSKKVRALPAPAQVVTLEIVSDEAYSDEHHAIYKGDVKVSSGPMRVFADHVVCNLADQVFRASGKSTRVQFNEEFVLDCKELVFDIKNQRGVASGGVRFVEKGSETASSGSASSPNVKTVSNLVFEIRSGETLSLSVQE
jgi:tetratricopeptide (TPR) repeat protein